MRRIVIDFDNTIANTSETLIKEIYKNTGITYKENFKKEDLLWNFSPYLTEDQAEYALSLLEKESSDFYKNLELIVAEQQIELYKLLSKNNGLILKGETPTDSFFKEDNCKIERTMLILVTNRTPIAFKLAKDWLESKGISKYFYQMICVDNFDKSTINADVRIDDKVECLVGKCYTPILFGDYGYQNKEIKQMLKNDTFFERFNQHLKIALNWDDIRKILKCW